MTNLLNNARYRRREIPAVECHLRSASCPREFCLSLSSHDLRNSGLRRFTDGNAAGLRAGSSLTCFEYSVLLFFGDQELIAQLGDITDLSSWAYSFRSGTRPRRQISKIPDLWVDRESREAVAFEAAGRKTHAVQHKLKLQSFTRRTPSHLGHSMKQRICPHGAHKPWLRWSASGMRSSWHSAAPSA